MLGYRAPVKLDVMDLRGVWVRQICFCGAFLASAHISS
jgi:hypothetical protein